MTTTTSVPRKDSSAVRESFSARIFGYDMFLSFALGPPPRGTLSYTSDLARVLRERDLTVFFSEESLTAGEELSDSLERALRRSRSLVLVANHEMLSDPRWVRKEVEAFRKSRPRGTRILINVACALDRPDLPADVHTWLAPQGNKWVSETAEAVEGGKVSAEALEQLLGVRRRSRANSRWRALVTAMIAATLVLIVSLVLSRNEAKENERLANEKEAEATKLQADAKAEKSAAESLAYAVSDPWCAKKLALEAWDPKSGEPTQRARRAIDRAYAQMNVRGVLFRSDNEAPFTGAAPLTGVAFSPDRQFILTSTSWCFSRLWDLRSPGASPREFTSDSLLKITSDSFGEHMIALSFYSEKPSRASFSFASYGAGRSPPELTADEHCDRAKTAEPCDGVLASNQGPLTAASFDPTRTLLVTTGWDAKTKLWTKRGELVSELGPGTRRDIVNSARFSHNGHRIVTAGQNGLARVWEQTNTQSWSPIADLRKRTPALFSAVFHPQDSNVVLTAGQDGTATMWMLGEGRLSGDCERGEAGQTDQALFVQMRVGFGPVAQAVFDPTGKFVVATSIDGVVHGWSIEQRCEPKPAFKLVGHAGAVTGVDFQADAHGGLIVTASRDGTARLWRPEEVPEIKGPSSYADKRARLERMPDRLDGKETCAEQPR